MYYFYLPDGLFPATEFYTGIIRDALIKRGEEVIYTDKVNTIPRNSKIVTISDKDFFVARILRKPSLSINWFQGIPPEEIYMMFDGKWYRDIKVKGRGYTEKYTVKHSDFNLFVSARMLEHYRLKYGYKGGNDFIMPCFNSELQEDSFTPDRYKSPSFVYVGNLDVWQCFEKTLALFKKIKNILPDATLSVFTGQRDEAARLLDRHGIKADIDYKSVAQLNKELKKFKYGFIVREDNEVNHVATPTKMCNYMASGLIPVFSDSLDAYMENVSGFTSSIIPFSDENDCIEKIVKVENSEIDIDTMKEEYRKIFDRYWNREYYIEKLSGILP